jgi:heme exporter protein A
VKPIEVKNLSKRYGSLFALREINLEINGGEVTVIMGPNGAGKSTILKILSGIIKPSSGEVRIFGKDPIEHPLIRKKIGFMSHSSFFYLNLSAIDNLLFYSKIYGIGNAKEKILNLAKTFEIEERLEDPVREYSRGMRQRLSLIRIFLQDPQILLLDEPFTGLDAEGVKTAIEFIKGERERGKTILMVTHHVSEAIEMGDRVVILWEGEVKEDLRGKIDGSILERIWEERN